MSITVSPSTISWLMGCSLKYSMLVEKRQYNGIRGTSPALRFGTAVHALLASLYLQPSGPHNLDNLAEHLIHAFAAQSYAEADQRQHDIARADRLVRAYMAEMDDEPCQILGVERPANFGVKVAGQVAFRIAVRHDMLLVREAEADTLIVRDWRVGSNKHLSIEAQWVNMAAARWAFPQYTRIRLELDSLNDDVGCERIHHSSSAMRGVVQIVADRVAEFTATEVHRPTPGSECHFCPCLSHCDTLLAIDAEDLMFC